MIITREKVRDTIIICGETSSCLALIRVKEKKEERKSKRSGMKRRQETRKTHFG